MQSQGPSQFPSWLPPHLVTSSPRWETRPQWLVSLGTPASAGRHLAPPQCLLQSTPEPWCVGSEDRHGRSRRPLQRQVSAVVPGFPGCAIVPGQSPLQVGHGRGLFEVNHGVGV